MNVYRLDPIDLSATSWIKSTVKQTIWVGAETPTKAREWASLRTHKAVSYPVESIEPIPLSPWQDDKVTSCVWEPSRDDVPNKMVITADGKVLSGTL